MLDRVLKNEAELKKKKNFISRLKRKLKNEVLKRRNKLCLFDRQRIICLPKKAFSVSLSISNQLLRNKVIEDFEREREGECETERMKES